MSHFPVFIYRRWEKLIFVSLLLICIFLCSIAVHCFSESPEERPLDGRKPQANAIFDWRNLNIFSYSFPDPKRANPFSYSLVNHLKKPVETPPPQPKQDPPKPATKPPEPANPPPAAPPKAPEQPPKQPEKPQTPPKPQPPPPPAPKEFTVTVVYRGFYVDANGKTITMLSVTGKDKKEVKQSFTEGQDIAEGIILVKTNDRNATFKTPDGATTDVPWNAKHTFKWLEK